MARKARTEYLDIMRDVVSRVSPSRRRQLAALDFLQRRLAEQGRDDPADADATSEPRGAPPPAGPTIGGTEES